MSFADYWHPFWHSDLFMQRVIDGMLGCAAVIGGMQAQMSAPQTGYTGLGVSILAFMTLIVRAWQSEREINRKDKQARKDNRLKRQNLAVKIQSQAREIEGLKVLTAELEERRKREKELIDELKVIRDMDHKAIAENRNEIDVLRKENEVLKARITP